MLFLHLEKRKNTSACPLDVHLFVGVRWAAIKKNKEGAEHMARGGIVISEANDFLFRRQE